MKAALENHLDALRQWRIDTATQITQLERFLREHTLLDDTGADWFENITNRLASEKLMVAFVAEYSRGKSELINAIFLSNKGRRLMPATVGRTTMCTVELAYQMDTPDGLSLLPISTRLSARSLTELYESPKDWEFFPLDLNHPEKVAETLSKITQTKQVSLEEATQLGLWNPETMANNPALDENGKVEVPFWRHARINLPHPLLKHGLVVLDTPGLNAIGVEIELTLSMLPKAHAIVFMLGADTGVTRSDLTIWQEHLSGPVDSRFVVLNKIDTLIDPLSTAEEIFDTIDNQRLNVAKTLGIPKERVFPLSARQALSAYLHDNAQELIESRLPSFEQALSEELLPQRWQILAKSTIDGIGKIQQQISQRINDLLRQYAEQNQELRSLRGKSSGKIQMLIQRIQTGAAEFEQCSTRLTALRNVHIRMLTNSLSHVSSSRLQVEVDTLIEKLGASLLTFGAAKLFGEFCNVLRNLVRTVQSENQEIHAMLSAAFERLNAEFGFALMANTSLDLEMHINEINLIEKNYVHHFSLRQKISLSQAKLHDRLRRMLISRIRVVFDAVTHETESWSKGLASQVDTQLRERRRNFKLRYESLLQIHSVANHLSTKLNELQNQQLHVQQLQQQINAWVENIVSQANRDPSIKKSPTENDTNENGTMTDHFVLDFRQFDTNEL